MQYVFARILLFVLAGPMIWAGHFLAIYALHGVACARSPLHGSWAGMPLLTSIMLGVGLVALALMALIYLRLRKRMPRTENPAFLPWLAGMLSVLSAVAIIWETIPVLMLETCI